MLGSLWQPQQGSQSVHVVSGSAFDGAPFQIALSDIAVGHGSSAKICKGHMLGYEPLVVAVKVFPGLFDPVTEALLSRELRAAREVSLRHPSILAFLGTATVGGRTAIVSLYMGSGNFMEYIKDNPGCDKKRLILQVAEGVEFLHQTAHLVHGDLKCANVLISDFGNALLADFGLSTFAEKSSSAAATMTAIRQMNTLRFAAPELLLGEGATTLSKTRESDVYAFGMLVLEALSEELPWPNQGDFSVMRKVCAGEHPARPMIHDSFVSVSHSWWDVCRSCWSFESRKRPQISDVLRTMRATEPLPCRVLPFPKKMATAAYMPNGSTIVAASKEPQSVMLFDAASGQLRPLWQAGEESVRVSSMGLTVSPDGQRIACSFGETVLVLDAASGDLLTSTQHSDIVTCMAYSPDGARIATGYQTDRKVRLWDGATGAAVGDYLEGPGRARISAVSFSQDGAYLAAGSFEGNLRLWDCATWTPIMTMGTLGLPISIQSISFSPDGTRILSARSDDTMTVWDAQTGDPVHGLRSLFPLTAPVVLSPTGKFVASTSTDKGDIRIRAVHDGELVGPPLLDHNRSVRSIAFSPDEKSLVSVAYGGKVRVWDLFE